MSNPTPNALDVARKLYLDHDLLSGFVCMDDCAGCYEPDHNEEKAIAAINAALDAAEGKK